MAETPEAGVKRQIRAILTAHDVYQRAPTTGGFGRSGQLDFTVCAWGYFLAVEAKSIHSKYGHKGPTTLQWGEIDAVIESGGIAVSIDETNLDMLHTVLTCLRESTMATARVTMYQTLHRHTRPPTEPDTDQPATLRKRK